MTSPTSISLCESVTIPTFLRDPHPDLLNSLQVCLALLKYAPRRDAVLQSYFRTAELIWKSTLRRERERDKYDESARDTYFHFSANAVYTTTIRWWCMCDSDRFRGTNCRDMNHAHVHCVLWNGFVISKHTKLHIWTCVRRKWNVCSPKLKSLFNKEQNTCFLHTHKFTKLHVVRNRCPLLTLIASIEMIAVMRKMLGSGLIFKNGTCTFVCVCVYFEMRTKNGFVIARRGCSLRKRVCWHWEGKFNCKNAVRLQLFRLFKYLHLCQFIRSH